MGARLLTSGYGQWGLCQQALYWRRGGREVEREWLRKTDRISHRIPRIYSVHVNMEKPNKIRIEACKVVKSDQEGREVLYIWTPNTKHGAWDRMHDCRYLYSTSKEACLGDQSLFVGRQRFERIDSEGTSSYNRPFSAPAGCNWNTPFDHYRPLVHASRIVKYQGHRHFTTPKETFG